MPERTTVVLCRHGNVDNPDDILYYRAVDVPLSAQGHEQMQTLGQKLKKAGIQPEVIYASVLTRAVQSAEEIAKSFPGVEIIKIDNLQDPDAPGIETRTNSWLAEIEAQGHDVFSHPELKDTIETREHVAERMMGVLALVLEKNRGVTSIVVSHGDPTAFLRTKLHEPEGEIPTITDLKKRGMYLEKGQALELFFDSEGNFIEEKLID